MKTKFVVLRGPSASGKSTVAKMLFKEAVRKTALIDQDHYRFIFKPAGGGSKPNADTIHKMIKNNVLVALGDGYDVILEGILSVKAYGKLLDYIFAKHPENNYMFYFDVSLEETIRRHSFKNLDSELPSFGEKEMREWYDNAHKSNHKLERLIPETFSSQQTLEFIKKVSGF